MSNQNEEELHLEIGHVLFIDIVGFSKLLLDEQKRRFRALTEIVLATRPVRRATNEQLIRLPTGDGMALVFRNSVEEPVSCAVEVAEALRDDPELPVRMGVHSGPVSEVTDVSGRNNIAGAGINLAQRVMDCGDAGHILLSRRVADDLGQYQHWRPLLHDLGECEVKHRVRLPIVNLYRAGIGNPARPGKIRQRDRKRWLRRSTAAVVVLAAIAVSYVVIHRRGTPLAASDKSIAVLPFDNLSEDKANAFFATGIQDEIITQLAKVDALKVISRNSTQGFASRPAKLSAIGEQLGVANFLEGSVQRQASAVLIDVQLIKAANNQPVWAESYNRRLDDIFAVEAEVSQKIATSLQATLTQSEQKELASKPTEDPAAHEAYLLGLTRLWQDDEALVRSAIDAFDRAVQLDPQYALAWDRLAEENSLLYFYFETTPARQQEAERCLAEATRLQPDLPETRLAHAYFLYWGKRDYAGARDLLQQLYQSWSGNSRIAEALGWVTPRLGDWAASNRYFEEAINLNPHDLFVRQGAIASRMATRDFPATLAMIDRALQIWPAESELLALKACVFQVTGRLKEAQSIIDQLEPALREGITATSAIIRQNRLTHQPKHALDVLEKMPNENKPYLAIAYFQQMAGDPAAAHATYETVRETAEAKLRQQPENIDTLAQLATAYAGLGQGDSALKAITRALALAAHDARRGTNLEELRVRLWLRLGDKEEAMAQLPRLLSIPNASDDVVPLTPDLLRLDPDFDPLRSDPRFARLCQQE